MTPDQQPNEWLATVKDRAMNRVRAAAAGAGTQVSPEQIDLDGIGVIAGASEMLTLLEELGRRRRPG